MSLRVHVAFALFASLIVAFAIAWGFFLVGSPGARRLERFDDQRLQDLQTIANEIQWMVIDSTKEKILKEALPATLDEAAERARGKRIQQRDPETGEPYRYTVKNETTFELCATFSRPRESDWRVFWNHPAGAHCFTINVFDPPPY